jgi:type I restriction enzyme R subunit
MAQEAERQGRPGEKLAAMQAQGSARNPRPRVAAFVTAANAAAAHLSLDEAETRKLIDEQLRRQAGLDGRLGVSATPRARARKGQEPGDRRVADRQRPRRLRPVCRAHADGGGRGQAQEHRRVRHCSRPSATAATSSRHDATLDATDAAPGGRVPPALRLLHQRPPLPPPARHQERRLVLRSAPARQPRPRARRLVHARGPERPPETRRRRAHTQLASEPFNYGFSLRHYQQAAIQAARPRSPKASARCSSPWPPAPARPRPASP